MKYTRLFSGLICTFLVVGSCGTTQVTTSQLDGETLAKSSKTGQNQVSMDEPPAHPNTTTHLDSNKDAVGANSNEPMEVGGESLSYSNDFSEVYTEANMTADQIESFESALEEFEKRKRTNANGEMFGTTKDEAKRQLREILSDDQYSAYESWIGQE